MKLNCDYLRRIFLQRGKSQKQCIDELNSIFCFREGRPNLVVVPATIDTVRELILQYSHITYREI